jgi:hypothetical protein
MQTYDICLAWNWEHDTDFVQMLESSCQSQELSLLQITPTTLDAVLESLAVGQINFTCFLDRASDVDPRYLPIVEWARRLSKIYINPYRLARRAWDKAEMDQKFQYAGLSTPMSIVLPAYGEEPVIQPVDLGMLGDCFAIKPAHGGGGLGVVVQATYWEQVLAARQEYPSDQYLLQAHITPAQLDSRPAWFRVIYCDGDIFPCWWHPQTHVYAPITELEEYLYSLGALRTITSAIHEISCLTLFSTEIAFTPDGCFTVIDHVNDPIDLRLQSKTPDGIPDDLVKAIANKMVSLACAYCHPTLDNG